MQAIVYICSVLVVFLGLLVRDADLRRIKKGGHYDYNNDYIYEKHNRYPSPEPTCYSNHQCGLYQKCIHGWCQCISCYRMDNNKDCRPLCGPSEVCYDDKCGCKDCYYRDSKTGQCEHTHCGVGSCIKNECKCPTCTELNSATGKCEVKDCGQGGYCNGEGNCVCGPCYTYDNKTSSCIANDCGVGTCNPVTNECNCPECSELGPGGKCVSIYCGENGYCKEGVGCVCPNCFDLSENTCKERVCSTDNNSGGYCNPDTDTCECEPCYFLNSDGLCELKSCGEGGRCDLATGQCRCSSCHDYNNVTGVCECRECGGSYAGYCDPAQNKCVCTTCHTLEDGICKTIDCGPGGYCNLEGKCECAPCFYLLPNGKCHYKDCGPGGTCNPATQKCECSACFEVDPNTGLCEGTDCGCEGFCDPNTDSCKCHPCSQLVNGKCERIDCGANGYCDLKQGCQCDRCHELNADNKCQPIDCGVGGQCNPENGKCDCIDSCYELNSDNMCVVRDCGKGGYCDASAGGCQCQPCHTLVDGVCVEVNCVGGYCDPYKNKCVCSDCYEPVKNGGSSYECQKISCGLGVCNGADSCMCPNCTYADANGRNCAWEEYQCGTGYCDVTTNKCNCPACDVKDGSGKCRNMNCGINAQCNADTKQCQCNNCFEHKNGRCIFACSKYASCTADGCRCDYGYHGNGKYCVPIKKKRPHKGNKDKRRY